MKFHFKKKEGQSLIEVMIALAVLTTGFLGILTLLAQSIFLSKLVSEQTVATYLASEGVELAKNLIDHDVYEHLAGFGTGWGSCFATGGPDYELDYTTVNCPPPSYAGDLLYYNSTTHMYGYTQSGAQATPYTRDIRVQESGNEITVESIVQWQVGVSEQTLELDDVFYNWVPS